MEVRGSAMENMEVVDRDFWKDKKVFITGHTGFKGSWLSLWLNSMGAELTGYALAAPTNPSLFEQCGIENLFEKSVIGDITDLDLLKYSMEQSNAEIVIHMAAQPLVRDSYRDPVQNYMTNVMGTVHLFEAVRTCKTIRVVLNVTTDKCYENQEWDWGYRESDILGGYDPYSSSKACSELITSAYRNSFLAQEGVAVGTARAGNVIGFGDWANERLVPDLIRSFTNGQKIHIRNPQATRPWQHVLEPLSGYLMLAQKLYEKGKEYSEAWNFGPARSDAKPVQWVVEELLKRWPTSHPGYGIDRHSQLHEAKNLVLDCSKAHSRLNWYSRWSLERALDYTVEGVLAWLNGDDLRGLCLKQIMEYENSNN